MTASPNEISNSPINDKVKISDLYIETVIGFYHWEHNEPQPLLIDITLGTCFDRAFKSDSLDHTLDYAKVTQDIKTLCKENRFHLLEGLANSVMEKIFSSHPVDDIQLSIRKPHALRSGVASIECYRDREQFMKNQNPNY